MTWEILWALILGFALSAVVQAVVRRATIIRRLGDDRPRTLAIATGFGAASSSCSYAAVALARSLFRKGASFTAAMAFEIASTNLVVELGVILALLISFVCSIGNVPLAGVLWNGGISFGGVVAFIFADLIIVPILVIYRKYYGTRMMLFILATFYATMAAAGYLIEPIFGGLGLIPAGRHAKVTEASIQWNYTTVLDIIFLDIIFLILAAALCYRFVRTGGIPMLRMMGGAPETAGDDRHAHTGP